MKSFFRAILKNNYFSGVVMKHIVLFLLFLSVTVPSFGSVPQVCNDAQNIEAKNGNINRIIQLYTQCIDTGALGNRNQSIVYNNRGNAYSNKGLYSKAIQDFDKAISLNPEYAPAYNGRGVVYVHEKLYDEAIQDFSKTISLNPDDALAYNNRGFAYVQIKLYDKALQDFDKAIGLDPEHVATYNNRGNAYLKKKLYNKAIRDFDKAISLYPQYVAAYNGRGLAYKGKKLYDKAIRDFDKALSLNPDYADAYNNKVSLLATTKGLKSRSGNQALVQKANKPNKVQKPMYHDTLATASAEPGKNKQAARQQKKENKPLAQQHHVLGASAFAWKRLPGAAKDIAISPEGAVYIIGTNTEPGGYAIYRWTGGGWTQLTGGGVAIAAGPHNSLWVVDSDNNIFRYVYGGWQKMPGSANDIAAGADGSVYMIGTDSCDSGNSIYRFVEPYGWTKMDGCGISISVSSQGTPWVSNKDGEIFRYARGNWSKISGLALEIAPRSDSDIWVTGDTSCPEGRNIFHYVNGNWSKINGCADNIALAPDGTIWLINDAGEIFNGSPKGKQSYVK